jgi:hypothetical protein
MSSPWSPNLWGRRIKHFRAGAEPVALSAAAEGGEAVSFGKVRLSFFELLRCASTAD